MTIAELMRLAMVVVLAIVCIVHLHDLTDLVQTYAHIFRLFK